MGDSVETPVCRHGKDVRSCAECHEVPEIRALKKAYFELHNDFQTESLRHAGCLAYAEGHCLDELPEQLKCGASPAMRAVHSLRTRHERLAKAVKAFLYADRQDHLCVRLNDAELKALEELRDAMRPVSDNLRPEVPA